MYIIVVYFIILVVIGVAYYYFFNKKKKALQESLNNKDFSLELQKADGYIAETLNNELSFLRKDLKDLKIDAINIATIPSSNSDVYKNAAKDTLKGLATLGAVRFQTVKTPKYLILSGSDLHLLDTDTDGNISNHFIFEKYRLESSSLVPYTTEDTEIKQLHNAGLKDIKRYLINLSTDQDPIALLIYDLMLTNVNNVGASILLSSGTKLERYRVVALDFFKKLGERYPNLKTF